MHEMTDPRTFKELVHEVSSSFAVEADHGYAWVLRTRWTSRASITPHARRAGHRYRDAANVACECAMAPVHAGPVVAMSRGLGGFPGTCNRECLCNMRLRTDRTHPIVRLMLDSTIVAESLEASSVSPVVASA